MDRNSATRIRKTIKYTSLSARRAWIEIVTTSDAENRKRSLSARRAWIEIRGGYITKIDKDRRSPQGERG